MTLQSGIPLLLASQSSARAGVLRAAGIVFDSLPAHVDEAAIKASARAEAVSAEDTAIWLAETKAERVAGNRPDAIVIGADQMLVCEDEWFDKPADLATAAAQLRLLRGKQHKLITAVVAFRGGVRVWHHLETPKMTMRMFSDRFLDEYLAIEGDLVCTSVGGYRLEGLGMHLFDRIDGEHSAILGLPMTALLGFLRQQGAVST